MVIIIFSWQWNNGLVMYWSYLLISHKQRNAIEKKYLERLKGFSNALNNVNQQPQHQQLQLIPLDKRRQTQQSILPQQHQAPAQVQRHHLMTAVTLSPTVNTPSIRIRQGLGTQGRSTITTPGRIGDIVVNRRDSISLPPSPTRSLWGSRSGVIKKETFLHSSSGDPFGKERICKTRFCYKGKIIFGF